MPLHHGHLRSLPPYVGGDDEDETSGFQAVCCGCDFAGSVCFAVHVALRELVDHLNDALLERGDDSPATDALREVATLLDSAHTVCAGTHYSVPVNVLNGLVARGLSLPVDPESGSALERWDAGTYPADPGYVDSLRRELRAAVEIATAAHSFIEDLNAHVRRFLDDS